MKNEQKIRFVIVDDEQSIRRLCMTVGQGLGFECGGSGNGRGSP